MTQGSRFPGFPAPSAKAEGNKHRGRVDITFTKWVTTSPLKTASSLFLRASFGRHRRLSQDLSGVRVGRSSAKLRRSPLIEYCLAEM